eukprot:scaffold9921_cov95-Cylindrotheca_fusiformis.AAC.2
MEAIPMCSSVASRLRCKYNFRTIGVLFVQNSSTAIFGNEGSWRIPPLREVNLGISNACEASYPMPEASQGVYSDRQISLTELLLWLRLQDEQQQAKGSRPLTSPSQENDSCSRATKMMAQGDMFDRSRKH